MENLNGFLDVIVYGEAALRYRGHRYFINGARRFHGKEGLFLDVFQEDDGELPGPILFDTCQPTARACLLAFLRAPIWDGRTFWEAKDEMEWVD